MSTPGPWKKGKVGGAVVSESGEGITVRGATGYEATLDYYGGHLVGESISPANIPLIAAAPDMLEALNDIVALAEVGRMVHVINRAEEAIAKAKGEKLR